MNFIKILFLFFACYLFFISFSTDSIIYKVLNNHWFLKENSGSSPMNTIVPYESYNEYDADKTAVILVHGTVSENHLYAGWEKFFEELEQNTNKTKEIKDKFRFYIYRYCSNTDDLETVKDNLKKGISEINKNSSPKSKIIYITSSLGGNLLCNVVDENIDLSNQVQNVISLGTPYWGVPLFNKEIKTDSIFDNLVISSTNTLYPVLYNELYWTIEERSKPICASVKNKIIYYAAYIDSPFQESQKNITKQEIRKWINEIIALKKVEHFWNALIHYKMSHQFLNQFKPEYLIQYNDGLVPIISSLQLEPNHLKNSSEKDDIQIVLQEVFRERPKSRIFRGIDHTDFTHYDDRLVSITDIVHEKSYKTLNEFIFDDLLETQKIP